MSTVFIYIFNNTWVPRYTSAGLLLHPNKHLAMDNHQNDSAVARICIKWNYDIYKYHLNSYSIINLSVWISSSHPLEHLCSIRSYFTAYNVWFDSAIIGVNTVCTLEFKWMKRQKWRLFHRWVKDLHIRFDLTQMNKGCLYCIWSPPDRPWHKSKTKSIVQQNKIITRFQ